MDNQDQLNSLVDIALAAGEEILEVYQQAESVIVDDKPDSSPITEADRRAHAVICERLAALDPLLPVLSEESKLPDYDQRRQWQRYWLVDPLDGTKEFIKRNGEFTVNIALVEAGVAVSGVVHVPVQGVTYLGSLGAGAWKRGPDGRTSAIACGGLPKDRPVRVVASRSHRDQRVDAVIQAIEHQLGPTEVVSMGSSLKICRLAEGGADIYPRLAPTSEWDTAAAHALLCAAGGEMVDTQFQPLRYNQKEGMLNPWFLAFADPAYDWHGLLAGLLD